MTESNLWLLPDGVQELDNATSLEQLRRNILDLLHSYGYELVLPPLLEFLDSLLIGKGNKLELDTIKITDQVSGRLMGLRADITPQIARIAAKSQQSRFCYVGDIAKARNIAANRVQMQIGAELFGHSNLVSDAEIINLMLQTLTIANIDKVYLDIGHVGIFRSLVTVAKLDKSQELNLVQVLQKKSKQDASNLLQQFKITPNIASMILSLIDLHGDEQILTEAETILDLKIVGSALNDLKKLAKIHSNVHFDLSELRGYSYHTGLIFAAFVEQSGTAIANGGRYDKVSNFFGKDQAATGFSADLLKLIKIGNHENNFESIFAPAITNNKLTKKISQLRSSGKAVVQELPDTINQDIVCSHKLELHNGDWQVVKKNRYNATSN